MSVTVGVSLSPVSAVAPCGRAAGLVSRCEPDVHTSVWRHHRVENRQNFFTLVGQRELLDDL